MHRKFYSPHHTWLKENNGDFLFGITEHAVKELGDIVFVELPLKFGTAIDEKKSTGSVESVKAVSDILAPSEWSGLEVIGINSALEVDVEPLKSDPEGKGWLYVLRPPVGFQLKGLSEDMYKFLIKET